MVKAEKCAHFKLQCVFNSNQVFQELKTILLFFMCFFYYFETDIFQLSWNHENLQAPRGSGGCIISKREGNNNRCKK